MCDLDLRLDGTFYQRADRTVVSGARVAARRLLFRPYVWISDEWFTPDGVPRNCRPLSRPSAARGWKPVDAGAEAHTTGVCASLRHEAGHERLKMPSCSVVVGGGRNCSDAPLSPILNTIRRGPTAGASCVTWMSGTRKVIPMKILPKRSPCGSIRSRAGAGGIADGR